MKRRQFIRHSALATAACTWNWPAPVFDKDLIIGHGDFRYKVDKNWGQLTSAHPVKDCHELVQDSSGRIILLTNHTQNNILIYDQSGKLLDAWGTEFPGGHGLTIQDEGGEDFLYLTDYERHEVIKTTLQGRIIFTISCPLDLPEYHKKEDFKPTETAIAPNGDIYITDGYGQQVILQYDQQGRLKNSFGGRKYFQNAHGICLDQRGQQKPSLLLTAREQNKLKRFDLEGQFIEEIALPGAYICRPVIKGDQVYLATLISKMPWDSQSGFITILDKDNRVVSVPGGSLPRQEDKSTRPMHQTLKIFQHPHDICVDQDENLYVAQWNSGQTYPLKLIRV